MQSVIKSPSDISLLFQIMHEVHEAICKSNDEFIDFDYEITLLTVTQKNGPTLFCLVLGHRQEGGDYQEIGSQWKWCQIVERKPKKWLKK